MMAINMGGVMMAINMGGVMMAINMGGGYDGNQTVM